MKHLTDEELLAIKNNPIAFIWIFVIILAIIVGTAAITIYL